MHIGFDAKRAFNNHSGLGNYSRQLIDAMVHYYPEHKYTLFTPKINNDYKTVIPINTVLPSSFIYKKLKSLWRSYGVNNSVADQKIDLYHGLSAELPIGLSRKLKKVVTVHDIIFEHFKDQYKAIDRFTYKRKTLHACQQADAIVVDSEQTKNDLSKIYNIPASKMTTVYIGYSPLYDYHFTEAEHLLKLKPLGLPSQYLLYTGTINERKNLLGICQAYQKILQQQDLPPLVIIGKGDTYKIKVQQYIATNQLEKYFIFLNDKFGFIPNELMPHIYSQATALLFPSTYEGFGMPIIEAYASGIPVITSNVSSMAEIGKLGAHCITPLNNEALVDAISKVVNDTIFRTTLIQSSKRAAQLFSPSSFAHNMMRVYNSIS
jgi:glycosyltransferase involved in cell wall biosynthesis